MRIIKLLGFRAGIIVDITHPIVVERSNFIFNSNVEISFASNCLYLIKEFLEINPIFL